MQFPGFTHGFPHRFPSGFPPGFPQFAAAGPPADTTALYTALGVQRTASASEIRRAYHRLARTHHPDRGGDPEAFKRIADAYDTLGDPARRAAYDAGQGVGASAAAAGPQVARPPPQTHHVDVTLEEIFAGTTRRMAVRRSLVDRSAPAAPCRACRGLGASVRCMQLGGMLQQIREPCGACAGQGRAVARRDVEEVLELHVPPGAPDGHRVVFSQKGDEQPGYDAPGDLVFVLRELPHATFRRRGADLYVERTLTLKEALCGFETRVRHLDGRTLRLRTAAGEVVRPAPDALEPPRPTWRVERDTDCTLVSIASGRAAEISTLREAVERGELRDQGVGCFVLKGDAAEFKQGTEAQCRAAAKSTPGATMHVLVEPQASRVRCVVGEGLRSLRDPTVRGNLFVQCTIVYPERVEPEVRAALLQALDALQPQPSGSQADAGECDDFVLDERDPQASYESNRPPDDDSDDDAAGGAMPQNVAGCQQQ